jgi:putative PIN family toxin of toxin-antitoxin system
MPKAVLDTGVLVSAVLNPAAGGASFDLLRFAREKRYNLHLSRGIIEETARVLLTRRRIRDRYHYSDADVAEFCSDLLAVAVMETELPTIQVVRDPGDDMILACALAARADYLVSRDKDLLSIAEHSGTKIITPEAFLAILRDRPRIERV